jgi:hypothetical protein
MFFANREESMRRPRMVALRKMPVEECARSAWAHGTGDRESDDRRLMQLLTHLRILKFDGADTWTVTGERPGL